MYGVAPAIDVGVIMPFALLAPNLFGGEGPCCQPTHPVTGVVGRLIPMLCGAWQIGRTRLAGRPSQWAHRSASCELGFAFYGGRAVILQRGVAARFGG